MTGMTSSARDLRRGAIPARRLFVSTARIARYPLGPWAAELRRQIAAAMASPTRPDEPAWCREIIRCGNNAALVQLHAGRSDAAMEICLAQIHWLRTLASRYRKPHLLTLTLQPWINIGRLYAKQGRVDDALRHFAEIRACTTDGPSNVGDWVIEPHQWARSGWTAKGLRQFGRSVWVTDSLRTLFGAGRYDAVLSMASSDTAVELASFAYMLQEAEVVALACLGRLTKALDRTRRYEIRAPAWERLILQLRRAECLFACGEHEIARSVVGRLIAVCRQISINSKAKLAFLLPIQHLLRLAILLDPVPAWPELAEDLYAAALRLDDEVLRVEALQLTVAGGVAGAERIQELNHLLETTAYAQLRNGAGPSAESSEIDLLFGDMMAALSA
ncbi:MAG TPA: hypothetical protein VF188_17100 [Longimicrobiales bacterium]